MSHEKPNAPKPESIPPKKPEYKIPTRKEDAEQELKDLKSFLAASKAKNPPEFYDDLLRDGKKHLAEEKARLEKVKKLHADGGPAIWVEDAEKRVKTVEDGIKKYEDKKKWIIENKDSYVKFLEEAVIKQKEFIVKLENTKEENKKDTQKPEKPETEHKHPHPENKKEVFVRRGAVVDTTALAEAQARDDANHRMTESKEDRDAGRVKRWWTRMWKHNIAQDYYQQKYTVEARKNIFANKNLYANEGGGPGSKEQYERAMQGIHARFTSDYKNELLKQGETYETIGERPEINNLIKQYGAGGMTDAAFEAEKNRILATVRKEYADKEKLYTDNLLQYAQELRDMCKQGKKISDMDVHVEITLGEAKERLNTEAKLRGFERCWDKFKSSGVGKIFGNEAAASLVGAAVYSAAKFLGLKALRSKVGQWLTFGGTAVAAGAIVGFNESRRLERERSQHSRDMAKGMMFSGDDLKRREHMDQFMYKNVRYATDVIDNLRQYPPDRIENGLVSPQSLQIAFDELVDLEARFRLGQERKIDLVRFSDPRQLEIESTALDLLRAELKCAMRRRYTATTGDPHYFDDHFNSQINNQITHLLKNEGGIEQTDKCFRKMKIHRSAMKGLAATAIGGVVGIVAQEAYHSILPTNTDSMTSGMWHHHHGQGLHKSATPLESLRRWYTGQSPRVPMGTPHYVPCGNIQLQLPEGVDLHDNGDGTFNIINGGHSINNVPLAFENGDLNDASQKLLASHDIYTTHHMFGQKIHETPYEYIKNHAHGTSKIHMHSDALQTNGTPTVSDHNELRVQLGGINNSGIDANGDYVFDVSHMTDDGSWNSNYSVEALQKMHNGELKMGFALSRDTQHEPYLASVGRDGKVHISKDSELGRLLFRNDHGKMVSLAKVRAVFAPTGEVHTDGAPFMSVLASDTGPGLEHGVDFDNSYHSIRFDMLDDTDTVVPYYVYAGARRPLEKGEYEKNAEPTKETPHDPHHDHDHDHDHDPHDDHGTPAKKDVGVDKGVPVDKKAGGKDHDNNQEDHGGEENTSSEEEIDASVINYGPWDDTKEAVEELGEKIKDTKDKTLAEATKDLEDAKNHLAGIEVLTASGATVADTVIEDAKRNVEDAEQAVKKAEAKNTPEGEMSEFLKKHPELKHTKAKNLKDKDGQKVFFAGDRNVFATIDEELDNGKFRFVYDDPKKHKEAFFDAYPLDEVYLMSDIDAFKNKENSTDSNKKPGVEFSENTIKGLAVIGRDELKPKENVSDESSEAVTESVSTESTANYATLSLVLNNLPTGKINKVGYKGFKAGKTYFIDGDKKREGIFVRRQGNGMVQFRDVETGDTFQEDSTKIKAYNMVDVNKILENVSVASGTKKAEAEASSASTSKVSMNVREAERIFNSSPDSFAAMAVEDLAKAKKGDKFFVRGHERGIGTFVEEYRNFFLLKNSRNQDMYVEKNRMRKGESNVYPLSAFEKGVNQPETVEEHVIQSFEMAKSDVTSADLMLIVNENDMNKVVQIENFIKGKLDEQSKGIIKLTPDKVILANNILTAIAESKKIQKVKNNTGRRIEGGSTVTPIEVLPSATGTRLIEKTGAVESSESIIPDTSAAVNESVAQVPGEVGLTDLEIVNERAGFDVKDFLEKNNEKLHQITYGQLQPGNVVFVYGKDLNGIFTITNKYSKTLFLEDIIKKEKGSTQLDTLPETKIGKKNKVYFVDDVYNLYDESISTQNENVAEAENDYQLIATPFDKDFKEDMKAIIADSIGVKINFLSGLTVEGKDNKIHMTYKIKNAQNVKENVDLVLGISDDGKKFVIEKSEKEGQPFDSQNLEKEINDFIDEDNLIKKIEIEKERFVTYE